MLFNSYAFLFFFLPLVACLFFILARYTSAGAAATWMAIASILFYGYWNPSYVVLLLASIIVNYGFGMLLQTVTSMEKTQWARVTLGAAITLNLLTLGYFKYYNFFLNSLSQLGFDSINVAQIVLPIGISFFTFTQIAYLVDTYQRKVHESRFIPYVLFVTYFPHLVAGPILHHAEMMPQFGKRETYRFDLSNFTLGLTIFAAGLFKKVIMADGIQPFVGPVFDSGAATQLSALEAWGGALAYTMQLYFDFSGYSDMAIGLSKMFNVDLPLNFNSPYKAQNIIEFWRRWHMTLSRFLRDYLYFPLGGNRHGEVRRYVNLGLTMILGGLWHGASWTFVIWGTLHGAYLGINHGWRGLRKRLLGKSNNTDSALLRSMGWAFTFIAVVYAWVFFRAPSLETAWALTIAMSGANGWLPPAGARLWVSDTETLSAVSVISTHYFSGAQQVIWTVGLTVIAWFAPNTQELHPKVYRWLTTSATAAVRQGLLLGSVLTLIAMLAMISAADGTSEFIYFNF